MPIEQETPVVNEEGTFYVDSYTRGRPMPFLVSEFPTLASFLSGENISINNVVIQFKDANNNLKVLYKSYLGED